MEDLGLLILIGGAIDLFLLWRIARSVHDIAVLTYGLKHPDRDLFETWTLKNNYPGLKEKH
jgi:hypothetical protein